MSESLSFESMTLKEIILKEALNTDKNTDHSYVDQFYDREFIKYRTKSITLVEIGVFHGESIKLWNKYFTNCTIYAVDQKIYNEEFKKYINEHPNINYVIGNAYTKAVANIIPNFDILIDDGYHSLLSQLQLLEFYLPKLKPGGVFIIEDVLVPQYLTILENHIDKKAYDVEKINLIPIKRRSDDLMLIVRRK